MAMMPAKMIMSVLGHTTLAEAERYTEEADQAGLAEDAGTKLEGHKANRFTQTTSAGLGKPSKSKRKSRGNLPGWRSPGEVKKTNTINGLGDRLGKLGFIDLQCLSRHSPKRKWPIFPPNLDLSDS